jgi:hypothetical protein
LFSNQSFHYLPSKIILQIKQGSKERREERYLLKEHFRAALRSHRWSGGGKWWILARSDFSGKEKSFRNYRINFNKVSSFLGEKRRCYLDFLLKEETNLSP